MRFSHLTLLKEFETPDDLDTKHEPIRLSRKMLNSFVTSRLISKQETSCELLGLDLFRCTESFRHIHMNKFARIQSSKIGKDGKDNFHDYINRRHDENNEMSLKQYLTTCSELKSTKKRKLDGLENVNQIMKNKEYKQEIMHPVGLNCTPCFPISTGKKPCFIF